MGELAGEPFLTRSSWVPGLGSKVSALVQVACCDQGCGSFTGSGSEPAERHQRNIEKFSQEPNGGLIVLTDIINTVHRDRIIALAATHRLPAIYPYRYWVISRGLASYGIDNLDLYRRAASYVDRIFRGANPAELPVQTTTKFELIINLKTAEALKVPLPVQPARTK
jgi:putative ABC transport system substrate-binding protein